jgi:hypothetical protein
LKVMIVVEAWASICYLRPIRAIERERALGAADPYDTVFQRTARLLLVAPATDNRATGNLR